MSGASNRAGGANWAPPAPAADAMSAALARNWWAVALRGIAAILFGIAALLLPFATIASLVLLWAAYLLVDGVFAITSAVRAAARHERWGWLTFEGIVNIIAGIVAFLWPGLTLLVLVTLLGIWAVISGVCMIVAGLRLQTGHGRWLLALSGLVSVVWGVLLYLAPIAGALVLTWWMGGYALVFGVMLLILAFRLRDRRAAPPGAAGFAAT